jgi:tetratricopeptide (TPR) repeat protein
MRRIVIIMAICMLQATVWGQTPDNSKYGADSIRCLANLSTVNEFVKIDLYDYAVSAWREVLRDCPQASRNTYIDGVKIVKHYLDKENDPKRKEELIDTLMMVYDYRIKYFGQEGYVIGRKGIDLMRYRADNMEEAYQMMDKSIELGKMAVEIPVLVTGFQSGVVLYKSNRLSKEKVVSDYTRAMEIIEAQYKKKPTDRNLSMAKDGVDRLFASSDAADCNTLVEIFEKKFKSSPEDVELIKNIISLFEKNNCLENSLYIASVEQLHNLQPSALSAYNLARLFSRRADHSSSIKYYQQAIELQTDNIEKSKYYYELALVYLSQLNQPENARSAALKAIEVKSDWGQPYILIGNIYAMHNRSCGTNDLEKASVYWAIVDKYIAARNADPLVAEEANSLVSRYSIYFPDKELGFFHGLKEGEPYTVGCWINETTRVRFK